MHVVDSLQYGGLERVVCDLAVEQQGHGHDVKVFSLHHADGFREHLQSKGIPVVMGGKRGALDGRVLRILRKHARNYDIVHTHNFMPNYYSALATLGFRRTPAIINTCHNMGSRLAKARLRWLYRWSISRTACVAMVGSQVHSRLVSDGLVQPSKAVTIFNGVPVEHFAGSGSSREDARSRLGIGNDALVIGCVGRLVELKNHRLLLSCLPELVASHPRLMFVLVGDGPLEPELRAAAADLGVADHVVFAGARNDVASLLPGFDIFALPSRTEGLSIALLEACASGLAVVASAVGGNPEIVRDGSTGRLFESDDGKALHDILHELLSDPMQRRRIGEDAREWVRGNASIASMRANYDRIYRDALNG